MLLSHPRRSGLLLVCGLLSSLAITPSTPRDVATAEPVAPETHVEANRNHVVQQIHAYIAPMPLESYVQLADDVAHVVCVAKEVDVQAHPWTQTVYKMEVRDSLQHAKDSILEVRVAGGETPEGHVVCSSAPRIEVGAELVVFLNRDAGSGRLGLLGLKQGTYVVDERGELHGLHARAGERVSAFFDRIAHAPHILDATEDH